MSKIRIFVLIVFTLIISISRVEAGNAKQCFEKHEFIDSIEGAEHLPKSVCFSDLQILENDSSLNLKIVGEPISGLFPLEKIMENEQINKQMTYIFSKYHEKDGKLWGRITLRISVDLLKETHTIDYTYLAAEFFVIREDGEADTHIYYYKRVRQ